MSKTAYIQYRGRGFWAYDIAQGILLKYLVDIAEVRSEDPGFAWLKDAVHSWRIGAVLYGLQIDRHCRNQPFWPGVMVDIWVLELKWEPASW